MYVLKFLVKRVIYELRLNINRRNGILFRFKKFEIGWL